MSSGALLFYPSLLLSLLTEERVQGFEIYA